MLPWPFEVAVGAHVGRRLARCRFVAGLTSSAKWKAQSNIVSRVLALRFKYAHHWCKMAQVCLRNGLGENRPQC